MEALDVPGPVRQWLGIGLPVLGMMGLTAAFELAMGRVPWCTCGHLRFWVGDIRSPELSQQVADWYSFTHIIHGFALYGLMRLVSRGRRWPAGWRVWIAALLECGWEALENSPIIIDRYRHTAAQGYTGDSIVNSMGDIGFCLLGYALAARLPVWVIVTLIIGMEVGVGYAIRDNLLLNIIMLIHPFSGIRRWQMGGG